MPHLAASKGDPLKRPIHRIRRLFRPWRALFIALVLIMLLIVVDACLTRPPADGTGRHIEGYCPSDATWVASSAQFPRFYSRVLISDVFRQVSTEIKDRIAAWTLAVRKATGIRPTPTRWRVWLGRLAVAATSQEGVGLCVRPGLLLRGADFFHRTFGQAPDDGISTFGPLRYGWREGFLIVSTSRTYVAASLTSGVPVYTDDGPANSLRIQPLQGDRAVIYLSGRNGLPISGWIAGTVTHRQAPLTLPDAWPETPLASVTASKWDDVRMLAATVWELISGSPASSRPSWMRAVEANVESVATQWNANPLPADWDNGLDECAVALADVDTTDVTPMPEAAVILRANGPVYGSSPFEFLAKGRTTMPYEWNNRPGTVLPWLGEKCALGLCSYGNDWFLASQEPVMAKLVGKLREGSPVSADIAVRIDWAKAAKRAEALARHAADLELMPQMNTQDAEALITPYIRAAAQLGALELEGRQSDNGRIEFEGFLARQPTQEK